MIKTLWVNSNLKAKVLIYVPAAIGWLVIIAVVGVVLSKLIF